MVIVHQKNSFNPGFRIARPVKGICRVNLLDHEIG